jgi:hypothetical protein
MILLNPLQAAMLALTAKKGGLGVLDYPALLRIKLGNIQTDEVAKDLNALMHLGLVKVLHGCNLWYVTDEGLNQLLCEHVLAITVSFSRSLSPGQGLNVIEYLKILKDDLGIPATHEQVSGALIGLMHLGLTKVTHGPNYWYATDAGFNYKAEAPVAA